MKLKLGLKKDYYGSVAVGYGAILINMIAQVVLIPLYISGLGDYNYGVYLLIYSFINYVDIGIGLFSGGILRILGERYAIEDYKGIRNAYTISKTVIGSYGVISAFMLLGYAAYIKGFSFFNEQYIEAVKIIVAAMIFLFVKYDLSVEHQALVGTQRQTLSNALKIIEQLIYLSFAIPYLYSGNGNVYMLFVFNIIGLAVVRLLIYVYHAFKHDHIKICAYNKEMKSVSGQLLGKMGISYAIYGILIITFQADTLLLGTLESNASLIAQYAMTWKVAEAARQVLWKIPESMQPYIIEQDAQGKKNELREQYIKIYKVCFCLSIMAFLCYGLLGKFMIKLWLRSAYVEISNIRIWLTAIVILLNGIERTPAIYAYSTLHLKELNGIALIEVILKTTLTIALYQNFGLCAPLLAMIITHICGIAYAYWQMGNCITMQKEG